MHKDRKERKGKLQQEDGQFDHVFVNMTQVEKNGKYNVSVDLMFLGALKSV